MKNINEKVNYILSLLPNSSGVYIMKDIDENIIYIGKAKNLKNRVSSYFNNTKKNLKTTLLVEKINDIEYFLTASEQDAFSLENNLIKQHQPKYNILLKDDKAFPYIRINKNELFPQLKIVRKVVNDGASYFGPFMTGIRVSVLMSIIKSVYPIRQCAIDFSKRKKKSRPCLYADLGKCVAPCVGSITNDEYLKIIDKVIDFLNGKNADVKRILTKKMNEASEKLEFENAIDFRSKLELLARSDEQVLSSLPKSSNFDCFAILKQEDSFAIVKTVVRNGKTIAESSQLVEPIEDDIAILLEKYIIEYYGRNSIPGEILTNIEISPNVQEFLSTQFNKSVSINVPKIGTKYKIVEQAEKNAKIFIEKNLQVFKSKQEKTKLALTRLCKILELPNYPNRVECYDISNISGVDSVASMVVFENGIPAPKEYRKFKIKTVIGANDFASLEETLKRRLKRLSDKSNNFNKRPDLIVIDGGMGQLHSANKSLQESGFDIPIISLAKKQEEICTMNSTLTIKLDERDEARKFLQRIRDEAHRFAITFHRSLHQKNSIK